MSFSTKTHTYTHPLKSTLLPASTAAVLSRVSILCCNIPLPLSISMMFYNMDLFHKTVIHTKMNRKICGWASSFIYGWVKLWIPVSQIHYISILCYSGLGTHQLTLPSGRYKSIRSLIIHSEDSTCKHSPIKKWITQNNSQGSD